MHPVASRGYRLNRDSSDSYEEGRPGTVEMQKLGERLADEAIAVRSTLPVKVAPVILEGSNVRLAPLDLERDAGPLHAVSNGQPVRLGERSVEGYDADALVWRYLAFGPFEDMDDFESYLRELVAVPDGLCLCVFDVATGHQVGVVTFMSNVPAHLKIELGNIWYSPLVQRTAANTESTYLMLQHAFELGYRRVEWKCNALNERSRRAALRMGFRFEGIQESHMIVKNRNRDTAWFRILEREWPEAKSRLEEMLAT
jgi:RimJ/RimL family protein N-acetyltransferase